MVVIGAGYSGLMAAFRLAPHCRVTLVDPDAYFTERVRLHELAAGRADVTHPLRRLLAGTGITHVRAAANRIDTEACAVHTGQGRILFYDRLVYALGSRTAAEDRRESRDGRVYSAESAAGLRRRLAAGPGTLTAVGGGPAGLEFATEIAGRNAHWRVRLVSHGPVDRGFSPKAGAYLRSVLRAQGVRVDEGCAVTGPDEVDGDAVLWTASMVPNTALAVEAGLQVNTAGRIEVDGSLRSVSHPGVYAVGDSAAAHSPAAGFLRMACQTALPTGAHAGRSIIRDLRGQEPEPMRFSYAGTAVSLGRHRGLVQFAGPDDAPRSRVLTGKAGAVVKEQLVRTTVRALRLAARRPHVLAYTPGLA